ncbi:hypothetical protein EIP86_007731 [Pleurotus ostreatoroseus]|nr:hypothetical protein EIP86_007731 [Pleurotus ostreatoroseus]
MPQSGDETATQNTATVTATAITAAQQQRPPSQAQRRVHPQFNFDDYNLILIIGDTEFRVNKSQLIRESLGFQCLLAGRTDNPITHILYHPEEDFAGFLSVIYNILSMEEIIKPRLSLVLLVIRLSTHYKVKRCKVWSLAYLKRLSPSGILDWLEYNNPMTLARKQGLEDVSCILDLKWERDCVTIANMARELELSRLHTTALYHYTQLPEQFFLFGIDNRKKLFTADRPKCLRARQKLLEADFKLFHDMFARVPVPHCETQEACEAARQQSDLALLTGEASGFVSAGPLTGREEDWLRRYEGSLCASCKASVVGELVIGRQRILDQLEMYFASEEEG